MSKSDQTLSDMQCDAAHTEALCRQELAGALAAIERWRPSAVGRASTELGDAAYHLEEAIYALEDES
jgi:hypothetical protein